MRFPRVTQWWERLENLMWEKNKFKFRQAKCHTTVCSWGTTVPMNSRFSTSTVTHIHPFNNQGNHPFIIPCADGARCVFICSALGSPASSLVDWIGGTTIAAWKRGLWLNVGAIANFSPCRSILRNDGRRSVCVRCEIASNLLLTSSFVSFSNRDRVCQLCYRKLRQWRRRRRRSDWEDFEVVVLWDFWV